MGYLHIQNLSKNGTILLFRECYALEKIHGTSAHVSFNAEKDRVGFFSGGASHTVFTALFDEAKLYEGFKALGHPTIQVFGEAYGGSMQKMKHVYGDKLRFVAFDVKIGDTWLEVPNAEDVAKKLNIDFVPWDLVKAEVSVLDEVRRRPSRQAKKNGVPGEHLPEGVVLRPLVEMTDHRGERIIVKYKNPEFSERESGRDTIADPGKALELANADAVATEWVTPMRLTHVLDKLRLEAPSLKDIPRVNVAMLEDVGREGAGEVDVTVKTVKQAIGARTVKLYKERLAKP